MSVVLVSVASFATLALAQGMWPTQDWKEPTAQELGDAWRDADPYRFAVIQGDFNGDGVPDQARILFASRAHEAAAFVYLSKGTQFERIPLARFADFIGRGMGVANVKPGRYETACSKSTTYRCRADEPMQVSIERDAISLFKTGSTVTYYQWNEKAHRFDPTVITE